MNKPLLVYTWEYGGELNEDTLRANGVAGILVRINATNGALTKDPNFDNQWGQAAGKFYRIVSFVYDPTIDKTRALNWLIANMPDEACAIIPDVEVQRAVTPAVYASRYAAFYQALPWNKMTYTGEGFLSLLAYWPTDGFWWGEYPNLFYYPSHINWTWDELRTALQNFNGPLNASRMPGPCKLWQFTSDKINLPGMAKADVSEWQGTMEQLEAFAGPVGDGLPPTPPPADTAVPTQEGVELYAISRYGAPVFVHVIDPQIAQVWVTGTADKFHQPGQTVPKYNASGGTNGGGWPYGSSYANEIWKSKGVLLQATAKDNRPWVGVTSGRQIVFGRGVPDTTVTDAVGYDRYLLENGVLNERYHDMTVYSNTVKDARTFSGRRADGKFVLCTCEGNDVHNYGLTFWEEALVLQEFGCTTGGNHDGGSSSTCINTAISSDSLNIPSDGTQAYVINAIIWSAGEVAPPAPGETMQYKVVWAKGASVRMAPSTAFGTIRTIPYGTVVDALLDCIPDADAPEDPNKRWVKLADGNYAASDYPDSTGARVRMEKVAAPPVPGDSVILNGVTITVNGVQYRADGLSIALTKV